jgi:hypothetical protein
MSLRVGAVSGSHIEDSPKLSDPAIVTPPGRF